MKIECDGFEFDFTDAINVFVFDEKDSSNPNYHGLSHAMKAVDLVVELENEYLFIEVKDIFERDRYKEQKPFNRLREILKYKYRDTWLYRWAEDKIDKPIHYLCLLELENGLIGRMTKEIRKQLPLNNCGPRWSKEISNSAMVLNFELWNRRFTAWPVTRVAAAAIGGA